MPRRIVGLMGRRGCGKDTVAKTLVKEGWQRLAYGDLIYEEVSASFGVAIEFLQDRQRKELPQPEMALIHCKDLIFVQLALKLSGVGRRVRRDFRAGRLARKVKKALKKALSPRKVLQWWGTEYKRRLVADDYWLRAVRTQIQDSPNTNFVVTDVRYPEEAELLRDLGGVLARVVRPSQAVEAIDEALAHPTETAMLNYPVDHAFINEEGLEGIERLWQATRNAFCEVT